MTKSKGNVTIAKKNKTSDSSDDNNNADVLDGFKTKTLEDLFEEELLEIYHAEQQLIKALPKMSEAAYSEDLEEVFTSHLEETERQAERLEKIFDRLEMETEEKKCVAMESLIEEGNKIISEWEESPVRDSALIISAQKMEHYEIAAYGSLCELAEVLGYSRISEILERTLEEEEKTDEKLTFIAQDVNDDAYELS